MFRKERFIFVIPDEEHKQIEDLAENIGVCFYKFITEWKPFDYINTKFADTNGYLRDDVKTDLILKIEEETKLIHKKFDCNGNKSIDRHKLLSAVVAVLLAKPLFNSKKVKLSDSDDWFHIYPNEAFIIRRLLSRGQLRFFACFCEITVKS